MSQAYAFQSLGKGPIWRHNGQTWSEPVKSRPTLGVSEGNVLGFVGKDQESYSSLQVVYNFSDMLLILEVM